MKSDPCVDRTGRSDCVVQCSTDETSGETLYFDTKPCAVCGSDVQLRARREGDTAQPDGPVGPSDGVVGGGDPTVDERVCTNAECPTNTGDEATRPAP